MIGTTFTTNHSLTKSADLQRVLEREKFDWQKDMEAQKNLDLKEMSTFVSSVSLAEKVAAAQYEVGSFLQAAMQYPHKVDEFFTAHETRMRELMPAVVASHTAVTAHDKDLFDRFKPLIAEISETVSCATRIYLRMRGVERAEALRVLFAQQRRMLEQLPERIYIFASDGKKTGFYTIPCDPPSSATTLP